MRICVAGAYGAFGLKHLDALAAIEGVTVTAVMGPTAAKIEALAAERGIGFVAIASHPGGRSCGRSVAGCALLCGGGSQSGLDHRCEG